MRLANGIIIDREKTFGVLKFSQLSRYANKQATTKLPRYTQSVAWLIELCSVFKLSPDALDALLLAQVNLNPGWSGGARAPECAVVVINRILDRKSVV